jgi:AcrR family transcriptional regulator
MPYSKQHKTTSKDRILKAAADLFSRYGFERVSIGEIMRLARLTHGAFYAHFESKEALYSASFAQMVRRTRAARLTKGPLPMQKLFALVTDYLTLSERRDAPGPGPEAILFTEVRSERREIKRHYEEAYRQIRSMLERRIRALGRLGRLPYPLTPEVLPEKSRAIMAALVGAVVIARSIERPEEQQDVLLAAQKQILALLGVGSELQGASA